MQTYNTTSETKKVKFYTRKEYLPFLKLIPYTIIKEDEKHVQIEIESTSSNMTNLFHAGVQYGINDLSKAYSSNLKTA